MKTIPIPDYPYKCFHVLGPDLFPGKERGQCQPPGGFLNLTLQTLQRDQQTASPATFPQQAFDCRVFSASGQL